MARRGLLSTADVLEELELDQGDFDADEPMMLGSDDEFDDVYLEDLEDEDDDEDNRLCYSPPPSDIPGSSLNTPTLNRSPGSSSHTPTPNGSSSYTPTPNGAPGTTSDTPPPSWSSILTSVNVQLFNSPAGPKVAIPESPSETFELLFTPTLLDDIAEQSNVYAKEVMGDEKFNSWPKITREEVPCPESIISYNRFMGGVDRGDQLRGYYRSLVPRPFEGKRRKGLVHTVCACVNFSVKTSVKIYVH